MTADTQRAYSRGYAAGRRDKDKRTWKILEIARSWRDKAMNGYGAARCESCALWTRGGARTKWGICAQDWKEAVDIGYAWAETDPRTIHSQNATIVSHDNFFCANWRLKEPTPARQLIAPAMSESDGSSPHLPEGRTES